MKSLRLRITFVFSIIVLLSGTFLSYRVYTSSVNLISLSLGEQARSIAESALKQIEIEKYQELTPEKGETEYYKELRQKLNQIREANNLKYLYTMQEHKKDNGSEYIFMVDGMPLETKEENFSPIGTVEENVDNMQLAAFSEGVTQIGALTEDAPYGALVSAYVPIKNASGVQIGIIGADFDASSVYALMKENKRNTILLIAAILLISVIITYIFSRMIVSPVLRLTREVQKVQDGQLRQWDSVVRKDEIGRLSEAFRKMVAVLREMILEVQSSVQDLRQSALVHAESTEASNVMSQRITAYLGQAAEVAENQVKCSEETVRTIGEVETEIQRVAASLSIAADAANEVTVAARNGNEFVQQAVHQMSSIQVSGLEMAKDIQHLADQSSRVSQITLAIREISAQTHLLSLNAAIEAARAGEHGQGFAVVADQIRKLAAQSEESAVRISELIESILGSTDRVVRGVEAETKEIDLGRAIVEKAGEAFAQIVNEVQKVAGQVQEVSAVSQQIAAGAEQVLASADETDRLTRLTTEKFQGISKASEEQLASLQQITSSMEQLNRMSERLEHLISKFSL